MEVVIQTFHDVVGLGLEQVDEPVASGVHRVLHHGHRVSVDQSAPIQLLVSLVVAEVQAGPVSVALAPRSAVPELPDALVARLVVLKAASAPQHR